MASIEDDSLNGGGYALKQMIWNAARDTIRYELGSGPMVMMMIMMTIESGVCGHISTFESNHICRPPLNHRYFSSEWTGQQLAECSLYGIRIYKEGAVLATHVDRLPLVSSAIINVDQDVDEPW